MKDYKIFLGSPTETWREALERFKRFCEADMKDYFSTKDYSYHFSSNSSYHYQPKALLSESYISEFSEARSITIPPSLVDMLCKHGAFRIGDNPLDIFDDGFFNLSQVLTNYGYEEFVGEIKPGMLKSLNEFYFFFGVSFSQSEEMSFLFFNKSGSFGQMLFAPHNKGLLLDKVLPSMFNGTADRYTLDSLISKLIDRVVINALTVRGYINL